MCKGTSASHHSLSSKLLWSHLPITWHINYSKNKIKSKQFQYKTVLKYLKIINYCSSFFFIISPRLIPIAFNFLSNYFSNFTIWTARIFQVKDIFFRKTCFSLTLPPYWIFGGFNTRPCTSTITGLIWTPNVCRKGSALKFAFRT